jgi:hypothetical protein
VVSQKLKNQLCIVSSPLLSKSLSNTLAWYDRDVCFIVYVCVCACGMAICMYRTNRGAHEMNFFLTYIVISDVDLLHHLDGWFSCLGIKEGR